MYNSKNVLLALILCVLVVFANSEVSAQEKISQEKTLSLHPSFTSTTPVTVSKSINNTTLLSEDFSNTQFPPTGWTMTIVTGTLGWSRGVGPQQYATFSTQNTTAANGYAFVNSDGNGGTGGPEHTILRTPAINCVGQNYVWLKFNNYFRQFAVSTGDVEVSNNGTSWVTVHSSHTGLAQHESTPNPQFVDINISAWAANQPTVYVRFKWTGEYDYYWFVDDVEIYSKSPYDAALFSATNLNEYSVVPKPHYNNQPLPLTATVKNVGGTSFSGAQVRFNVYDGNTNNVIHTVMSNTSGPVAAGSTVDLTAASYVIPPDTGYYIAEYIVSIPQADADSSNDTLYRYFWISDSIYARDEAIFTETLDGALGIASGGTVIMGQNFQLAVADKLSRVSFYVTGPAVGDTTQMFLYSTDGTGAPLTLLASSNIYIFTTAAEQWVTLTFSTGTQSLNPGTYFIGVKDYTATDNLGLGYNNNHYTPNKTWIKINDNAWQTTESAGFPVAYVLRPYFVCAGYMPFIQPSNNVGLCQGANATLTSSPGTAYLWSPGNETTQSILVTTPGTYSVSVTNSYGCSAQSLPVTVSQVNNPVINLGNDTTVCGFITLNAGSGYASYSWSGGTSNTQHLNVSNTGQYIVVVTDTFGCVGLDTINVTVTSGPTVNLGQDMVLCHYETAILDAGQGFTSYLWNDNSTNQTLTVDINTAGLGSHNFFVVVTDANNCVATDTVIITFQQCVGIGEDLTNSFYVYPNPAKDYINVTLPDNLTSSYILEICDVNSRVVISELLKGQKTEKINIKHLNSGMYIIRVVTENNIYITKMFVD